MATLEDLSRQSVSTKLVIDLSVPRNVDPAIAFSGVRLLNIDEIQATLGHRGLHLANQLMTAEDLIATAVRRHVMAYKRKEFAQMAKVC